MIAWLRSLDWVTVMWTVCGHADLLIKVVTDVRVVGDIYVAGQDQHPRIIEIIRLLRTLPGRRKAARLFFFFFVFPFLDLPGRVGIHDQKEHRHYQKCNRILHFFISFTERGSIALPLISPAYRLFSHFYDESAF